MPETWARRYHIFPLEANEWSITIASAHYLHPGDVENLRFSLERTIHQCLFPQEKIEDWIQEHYPGTSSNEHSPSFPNAIVDPNEQSRLVTSPPQDTSLRAYDRLREHSQQNPIVQHVTMLLNEAIEKKASDVHLESFEHECRIRYRIDGVMLEKKPLPLRLALPIMSRLKLLAQLDITESRLPQDGRLQHTWENITVDFRISSLPTQFGESLVLRLLDRRKVISHISSLSLPALLESSIHQYLNKSHGLFIVTGPTGAGKTTTLYALLQELQARNLKLLTAEDPVEYEIEGIIQIPVQEAIGRTFQQLLRSFLRHDPDVIMIGETRDEETAKMAMQASLTGHLVMTSLHTNDAAGAITRLMDMGLDPLLLATTLEGVLAQRLVRKLCPFCRSSHATETCSHAQGCDQCHYSGYQGRIGIFELLMMSDELRLLIHEKAPHYQLRAIAQQQGMISLQAEADRYVREGITSAQEVNRAMYTFLG